MKKVFINGYTGRVGSLIVQQLAAHQSLSFMGGANRKGCYSASKKTVEPTQEGLPKLVSQSDGIIDFSLPESNEYLLSCAEQTSGKSFLICTTGLSQQSIEKWQQIAIQQDHRVLVAANTSLGVLILRDIVREFGKKIQSFGFDVELVETHHKHKKDSPSGTAHLLLESFPRESIASGHSGQRRDGTIGVHAVRGGGVLGEHELRFISESEELILSHKAITRDLFAVGALKMLEWLLNQKVGAYHLKDVDFFG